MPVSKIDVVIASRRFFLLNDRSKEIAAVVGQPTTAGDGSGDVECHFQIQGIGDGEVRAAVGVDSLQALESALFLIQVDAEALLKEFPDLRWEDAPPGHLGFPARRDEDRREPS